MINVNRINSNFFPWVNDPAAVVKKQGKKLENLSDGRTKKKTLLKKTVIKEEKMSREVLKSPSIKKGVIDRLVLGITSRLTVWSAPGVSIN